MRQLFIWARVALAILLLGSVLVVVDSAWSLI